MIYIYTGHSTFQLPHLDSAFSIFAKEIPSVFRGEAMIEAGRLVVTSIQTPQPL